jgi:hypothetical protein
MEPFQQQGALIPFGNKFLWGQDMRHSLTASVAAAMMAMSAIPAHAGWIESLGSELSFGYFRATESSSPDLDGYYISNRSSFRFGNSGLGGGLNSGFASFGDGTDTGTFRSLGAVVFYQVNPSVRIGTYGDFGQISVTSAADARLDNFGIEASYAFNSDATISGYVGQYDSDTLTDPGMTFGLRSDVRINDSLSVYGVYYCDDLGSGGTLSGGNIGGSLALATVFNRPLNLDVTVGRFNVDGDIVDTVSAGFSVPLFATFRDTQGWQGGPHGGYANLLTGD